MYKFILLLTCLLLHACTPNQQLFKKISPESSNIHFNNTLTPNQSLNPYYWRNFYNGSGVGLGDFNNDGLLDIFLAGTMVANKLYLNQGNLKFKDITEKSNIATTAVWSTGVSIVDINNDGWLDIYVSRTGPPTSKARKNSLYINNKNLTFTDKAYEYGLDFVGLSIHASFFDFDKDGDLDCYLLDTSGRAIGGYDLNANHRIEKGKSGGNKLLENRNGVFVNITKKAGVYSSMIGYGLGVTISDINQDHWPDIYISNDFFERDYLYINQQNGTFKEDIASYIQEQSLGSMGADMADINNDGYPEIFVSEMRPKKHDRLMSKTTFYSYNRHQQHLEAGYMHQFSRNVLQLNNKNGTFSEIGRLSGLDATDWSWGALIFDMNNDGLKDIFIANGIAKDLLDYDYINYMSKYVDVKNMVKDDKEILMQFLKQIPSQKIPNDVFKNLNGIKFKDIGKKWGFEEPTFSNGAAYGDLDNDGDLDLVINNINMKSSIYENQSNSLKKKPNYIALKLIGENKNITAIGSKVTVYTNSKTFVQELNPMRGFMSSVDYKLTFGIGNHKQIDKIEIIWPNTTKTTLTNITPNQLLIVDQKNSITTPVPANLKKDTILSNTSDTLINFKHHENYFSDFNINRLLHEMISTEGPAMCKADVNNDQLEDIYIGGAINQHGYLFIQTPNQKTPLTKKIISSNKNYEEVDCAFFDANNDGHIDLIIASGGSEFYQGHLNLKDRLFLGDGKGNFEFVENAINMDTSIFTGVILPLDIDNDGDQDLFVGNRGIPYFYGLKPKSHLLINDGNGYFSQKKVDSSSQLNHLGMVTDAKFDDLNNDGNKELIIVGHWMPITILEYKNNTFINQSKKYNVAKTFGWYNSVTVSDINNDGKKDLLTGNHGLNSHFKASPKKPIELFVSDIDNNGQPENILSMYFGKKSYPFLQLRDLHSQIPLIKKEYLKANQYKNITTKELLKTMNVQKYAYNKVTDLKTRLWINQGTTFQQAELPIQAQFYPVYTITIEDFNNDSHLDIFLGGNFLESRPEYGNYQAGQGTLLLGNSTNKFKYIDQKISNLSIKGVIRKSLIINNKKEKMLITARNNDTPTVTILKQTNTNTITNNIIP
ncbi:hypothetical protein DID76_02610 [Candidatus Marinamargulisbacteria bacterium SCGC AG-414-C22]|nr:hypothetical protein DID76_02610 [Candidatus Marinamargulisbacteria bacterium SCGC AG-414-C22]